MKLFGFVLLCCHLGTTATDVGYLLHMTDVHLDLQYQVGAPTRCLFEETGVGCCRNSSIPLPEAKPAGPWGSDNCDTAPKFWEATLQWIAEHLQVDAILWTGDVVDHNDLEQTWTTNRAEMAWASSVMKAKFPDIPVFPCLGNHDTWPIDQLYPHLTAPQILQDVTSIWQTWLTSDNQKTFVENGVYQQSFGSGQVVALNSLYLDPENLAVFYNTSADIGEQFNFLETALFNTSLPTWILGHIPPGSSDLVSWFAPQYALLAGQPHVQAHFWGHTHHDEFRLLFDARHENVTGVGFVAPSLMIDGHFPAFRRYLYNKTSLTLLDYEQYWLNWTLQLIKPDHFIGYFMGYTASQAYNLSDLSPSSFADLLGRMKQNQSLVQQYAAYSRPQNVPTVCDAKCCHDLLCDMEFVEDKTHDACLSS